MSNEEVKTLADMCELDALEFTLNDIKNLDKHQWNTLATLADVCLPSPEMKAQVLQELESRAELRMKS